MRVHCAQKKVATPFVGTVATAGPECCYQSIAFLLGVQLTPSASRNLRFGCEDAREINPQQRVHPIFDFPLKIFKPASKVLGPDIDRTGSRRIRLLWDEPRWLHPT